MTKDSEALEILVAKIQQQLAPDASVEHNVKLLGRETGVMRQVDVLVRQSIGQHEMNIVLECKDYSRPADVKKVEEFSGLLQDVGAHKGSLVCPRGFTKAAKTRAEGLQIDLYSPVDTDPHKWQARVSVPTVCSIRSPAFSFGIKCSVPKPFMLPHNFANSLDVKSPAGEPLGTIAEAVCRKWNVGGFPSEPGEHPRANVFEYPEVLIDNGYKDLIEVELDVGLMVVEKLYFGQLSVKRFSGFRNEISGGIIGNSMTFKAVLPEELERHWTLIESMEDLPRQPAAILTALLAASAETS